MLSLRRLIAVTCGDPAGIGPEVCLKGLERLRRENEDLTSRFVPVIFGDDSVLRRVGSQLGLPMPMSITDLCQVDLASADSASCIYDLGAFSGVLEPGNVTAETGLASYRYIEAAISAAQNHLIAATVTGPIHKEAIRSAGILHPGHTEIFAALTNADRACMMLTSDELTCSFVTTHVGYKDVPALLSRDRILDVIEMSHDAVSRLKGRPARLAVCGLNPHAGEHGLFGGGEEERIILPAIEKAIAEGIDVEGPLPPDTAFLPARRRQTDCFVCMYHDQGHIPLKALAFDEAVNITLGLPIVRTSVDHGTALDIAWQGKADETSLVKAFVLACRLVGERT